MLRVVGPGDRCLGRGRQGRASGTGGVTWRAVGGRGKIGSGKIEGAKSEGHQQGVGSTEWTRTMLQRKEEAASQRQGYNDEIHSHLPCLGRWRVGP